MYHRPINDTCHQSSHFKATSCRKWHSVGSGAPPRSFWVQHHSCKDEPQVCYSLSDVMSVLCTNTTHEIIKILCVECLYVGKNVCKAVTPPSRWSYTVQKQVMETETPFTLLQDTVPPMWFWSCYFKVHNVADWHHLIRFCDCHLSAQLLKLYRMKTPTQTRLSANSSVRSQQHIGSLVLHWLTWTELLRGNFQLNAHSFIRDCIPLLRQRWSELGSLPFERDFSRAAGRRGMLWEDWWGHRAPNALPFKHEAAH